MKIDGVEVVTGDVYLSPGEARDNGVYVVTQVGYSDQYEELRERVAQVVAHTIFRETMKSPHEETTSVGMREGHRVASALLDAGLLSDEVLAEVWVSARLFGVGVMARNEDGTFRCVDARTLQIEQLVEEPSPIVGDTIDPEHMGHRPEVKPEPGFGTSPF